MAAKKDAHAAESGHSLTDVAPESPPNVTDAPPPEVDDAPKTTTTDFNPLAKSKETPHFETTDDETDDVAVSTQPIIDAALNVPAGNVPRHKPDPQLLLKAYEVKTQGRSLGVVSNVPDQSAAIAEICRVKRIEPHRHNFTCVEVPNKAA